MTKELHPTRITPHAGFVSFAARCALSTLFSLLAISCVAGCREHPQVTSRESLEFIKQVYTACNTRNQERLNACKNKLDNMVAEGQLSEAEQNSFRRILGSAESGDWETAQRSSLQFARDQVR